MAFVEELVEALQFLIPRPPESSGDRPSCFVGVCSSILNEQKIPQEGKPNFQARGIKHLRMQNKRPCIELLAREMDC